MAKELKPNTTEKALMTDILFAQSLFGQYRPDDLITLKGPKIYRQMMTDEQIKVVVQFRKNAVVGRDWYFCFDDDVELSDDEKEKRIAFFSKVITDLKGSFKDKLKGVMSSLEHGFSLTEKVYKPIDFEGQTFWGLKSLRTKPFDTFDFVTDEYGELQRIEQRIGAQTIALDSNNFIHHVHNPNVDEHYGQSELREIYRSYFAKDIIIKLENIRLERHAGGFIWIGKDGDAVQLSASQKTDFEEMLRNINTKTGLVLPKGYNLNLESPSATDEFDAAKKWHDRAIAKGLLMPALLGYSDQGSVGSNAQAQTQQESFLWMLDNEADDLAETLNEQLFKELGEINFDDGVFPRIKFNELSNQSRDSLLSIWGDLVTRGAVTKTRADEERIRDLLDMPEFDEDDIIVPPPPPIPTQAGEDTEPKDKVAEDEDDTEKEDTVEESVLGKGAINIDYARFTKAAKRVNFTAIKESSDNIAMKGVMELQTPVTEVQDFLINQIEEKDLLKGENINELNKLKIPSPLKTKLKKKSKDILTESWRLGSDNAKNEMEGVKRFSQKQFYKFTSLGDLAVRYLESKGFQMSGNVTNEIQSVFNASVLSGIKYGRDSAAVVKDFLGSLATRGLVDPDYYEEKVGLALDVDLQIANPQARLNTIVRTNSFEAINEARFEFFTSPDLAGFVDALEYSAIMDSRVTRICAHLEGRVYLATSDVWDKYRPPNHYNCRSILVAVTPMDSIDLTEDLPTVEPQSGFG